VTTPRPRDLVTAQAQALQSAVAALPDTADPQTLTKLRERHTEADPAVLTALATQVRLQRRAADRLGPWATEMVLEEEALQQATRRDVARYRSGRLSERLGAGEFTVADIGCGLGVDARALAEAGFHVLAVEHDAWRAEAAEVNLAVYAERIRVLLGDALALDPAILDSCDAAYVDPARRTSGGPRRIDGGRSRATTDPAEWSPPWPWVLSLAERMPVVAKVAPGFDPRRASSGADVEWIDHDGEAVEASVWMGSLGRAMRRATALTADRAESLEAPRAEPAAVGPTTDQARRLLVEPSPAIARADLLADLAVRLGADRLDGGGWLTADATPATLLARTWRIAEEVPHGARELRTWLRGRGSVTWKTADAQVSATTWDRRVGHRSGDGPAITIVITGQGRAFAVDRVQDRPHQGG
jgi:SAM-dependent methyltransferase